MWENPNRTELYNTHTHTHTLFLNWCLALLVSAGSLKTIPTSILFYRKYIGTECLYNLCAYAEHTITRKEKRNKPTTTRQKRIINTKAAIICQSANDRRRA